MTAERTGRLGFGCEPERMIDVEIHGHGACEPYERKQMTLDQLNTLLSSDMIGNHSISGNTVSLWLSEDIEDQWQALRDAMQSLVDRLAPVLQDLAGSFAAVFENLQMPDLESCDCGDCASHTFPEYDDYDPITGSWSGDGSRYIPPEDHKSPDEDAEAWLNEVAEMLREEDS